MSRTEALAAALRARLGGGVAVMPVAGPLPLWPGEAPAMARAVPARLAEFSTGRHCARAALAELGMAPAAIPMGPDRAPLWPEGVVGSISHGAGLCAAIVGRTADCAGLGLDIEPDEPLPADIAREVLSAEEVAAPEAHRRAIFSAKEAVYKAFYPLTGEVWSFDAVAVRLTGPGFEARLTRPVPHWPADRPATGHLIRADGVIVTALALPPSK